MTIESSIEKLAAALDRVADALLAKGTVTTVGPTVSVTDTPKAEKPAKAEKPETVKAEKSKPAAVSDAPPADTPVTPEPTAAPAIDFTNDVQKPIVGLVGQGRRDAAVKILTELGVKKASEIDPKDYARAVELIKAAG